MGDRTPVDITVIIPSYNHESFIQDTLLSVLSQTYGGFRVIVVDDVSSDATVERARSIQDPRITVRVNPTHLGLGNSILSVLDEISTPFIALLNSDDLFHPDRLARCREVLVNSPETQLVATDVLPIDKQGHCLNTENVSIFRDGRKIYYWVINFHHIQPTDDRSIPLFLRLLECNFLVTSSDIVCRTQFLRDRTEALRNLNYCLDWQLYLDASLEGGMTHLREKLVAYRLHSSNTVWFVNGNRASYFFEANRVIGRSLMRFLSWVVNSEIEGREIQDLLRTALMHLAGNELVDDFGLYVNAFCHSLDTRQADQRSSRAREIIQSFYAMAQTTQFRRKTNIGFWLKRLSWLVKHLGKKLFIESPLKEGEAYEMGNFRKQHK
jgi:glycosyltransferase involved in cell wall biosynthesis